MINLDKQLVSLQCPFCKFRNEVSLKQIRINDVVICRGCKANLQLHDHMRSTYKAVRSITHQLSELEKSLQQIGEITFRL